MNFPDWQIMPHTYRPVASRQLQYPFRFCLLVVILLHLQPSFPPPDCCSLFVCCNSSCLSSNWVRDVVSYAHVWRTRVAVVWQRRRRKSIGTKLVTKERLVTNKSCAANSLFA